MKVKQKRSYKTLFTPNTPIIISGDQVRYFVIKGSNNLPAAIHMASFKDGVKISGHKLIPSTLTDKTFCFQSLAEIENYRCPCKSNKCSYNIYLLKCLMNFRAQMHVS